MKKLIIILFIFICLNSFGQYSTIDTPLLKFDDLEGEHPILAEPITGNILNATGSFSMVNQETEFTIIYLPKTKTITGAAWLQIEAGWYTASNYNGIAIYSFHNGILTYIDKSINDKDIWAATANTIHTKAFSHTHVLTDGVYVIAALYCSSAETTVPKIASYIIRTDFDESFDFSDYLKSNSTLMGQITMPDSTQKMKVLKETNVVKYFALY